MQSGWQDVAAIGVSAIAVVYLCRRVWLGRTTAAVSGCGGSCPGCSAADLSTNTAAPASPPQIIPIETLRIKSFAHSDRVTGKT